MSIVRSVRTKDLKVGDVFESNQYGKYELTEIVSSTDIGVRFIDTGYTRRIVLKAINTGGLRDRLVPSVSGAGYLGDASKKEHPQAYSRWKGMIERCYAKNSSTYKHYGGLGVRVSDEWLSFENFVNDFALLEGFPGIEELEGRGYHLDKDLKQRGVPTHEKVYSKETCVWLPSEINNVVGGGSERTATFIASHPLYGEIPYKNLQEWCRVTGHIRQNINSVLTGRYSHHFGWSFRRIPEEEYLKLIKTDRGRNF